MDITAIVPDTMNGRGLKAEYYNGMDFNDFRFVRLDETINADWGGGAPDPTIDNDAFSVRWSGKVTPRYSEVYTFHTETHGGVRLWVDGQLLFDDWNGNGMVNKSGDISLTSGQAYDIKMEYKEDQGSAQARLYWSSLGQNKEIIPRSRLNPPFIPPAPSNIQVTESSNAIILSWEAVDGASGYDVEADGVVSDNGDNMSFVHDGLQSSTVHRYRIRAKVPEIAGDWSMIVVASTGLGIPANIITEVLTDRITLQWDAVEGASNYEVEADGNVIDNGNATTFGHDSLMPDTEHTYRVRATNGSSTGDWSEPIRKTVLSEIPTNIQLLATSFDMTLTWDGVPGAVGYDVEADDRLIDNGNVTMFVHSVLSPNTRHTYRIRARFDRIAGEWSAYSVKSTLTLPGSGTGLKGDYFDGEHLTDLKSARIDDRIDFDWENRSPSQGIDDDDFSVRWTGQVEPRHSEMYLFSTEAHGGIRMWVNGTLLIDDWSAHSDRLMSGSIPLEAGQRYDIQVEYREVNGTARARLFWESDSQAREIVPRSQLYPIGVPQNPVVTTDLHHITLTWDPVTFAEEYEVEADGTVINNGASTSYSHENLSPGTMHTYRIRAKNGIVIGEWSAAISGSTLLGQTAITELVASDTSMTVSWSPVDGATGYEIEANGMIFNNGSDTQFTHENLASGTLYGYRVRPRTNAVTGDWSELTEKWTLPGIPTNVTTSPTGTSITLLWDEVLGATGYDVEANNTISNSGAFTVYTEQGLSPNSQRTYRIRARNSSGDGQWSPVIAETTLPGIPAQLKGEASDTTVLVNWELSAGATSYELMANGLIVPNLTDVKYLDEYLSPNTVYSYKIRAKSEKGASEWSNPIEVTTLPSVPQNVTTEAFSTEIIVTWGPVSGATGYEIEADGTIIDNGPSNRYVHEGLEPNTEHVYRVRAKNGSILGHWSAAHSMMTSPGIPHGLHASVTSREVVLSWDVVIGATGYDVEADGEIIDTGMATVFSHEGLQPNSRHVYRIRARNAGGPGQWSEPFAELTNMDIPVNLQATSSSKSITLTWNSVEGITGYDVMVDGEIVDNGLNTTFEHTGLEPFTIHAYRARAKAGERTGEWSEALSKATMLGTPANMKSSASSTQIMVTWDEVSGASGYEIEVDGSAVMQVNEPSFTHKALSANSEHKYRIRAKNDLVYSEWTEQAAQFTTPGIPVNLEAKATTNTILLTWDAVSGASSYQVEVDGKMVTVQEAKYEHKGLKSNTMHVYRVRAGNKGGTSGWTELLHNTTTPALEVNAGIDTMFNFVLVVPQKTGVNQRKVTVTYNPEEVEVLDLCAITPTSELETGRIEGTDITVIRFEAGEIVYFIDNADRTVMNSIRFMANTNEHSEITYVVE